MFNEKDLKRICSKEKGVTEQSVMEILKEEMDGMYDSDMLVRLACNRGSLAILQTRLTLLARRARRARPRSTGR